MGVSLSGIKKLNWKEGRPKCRVCPKQLSGYKNKTGACKKCSFSFYTVYGGRFEKGYNPPFSGKKGAEIWGSKENHPRWISDRSKLKKSRSQAYDYAYKLWMREVKNRDGWKCKISNDDCSGRLEAHHILGWKSHPELRYEINNGITLCHLHHPRKRSEEERLSPYFQNLVTIKVK